MWQNKKLWIIWRRRKSITFYCICKNYEKLHPKMIEMWSFGRIFSLLFVPIPLELYRVLTSVYSGVPGVVTSYSLTSLSGRWPLIYNRKLITIKTLMHVLMIFFLTWCLYRPRRRGHPPSWQLLHYLFNSTLYEYV